MQADTQKWRPFLPLAELTDSELELIEEATDRLLEATDPSDERVNWFGAFHLGQSVRHELASRCRASEF